MFFPGKGLAAYWKDIDKGDGLGNMISKTKAPIKMLRERRFPEAIIYASVSESAKEPDLKSGDAERHCGFKSYRWRHMLV